MSILAAIGGIGALTPLLTKVFGTIDKVVPDSDLAQKLKHELGMTIEQQTHTERVEQIKTNRQEAKHSSRFVSGWRPFVGWTCGAGLAYAWLGQPLLAWFTALAWAVLTSLFGTPDLITLAMVTPPAIANLTALTGVLSGLLGISVVARSVEKVKGVARKSLSEDLEPAIVVERNADLDPEAARAVKEWREREEDDNVNP